MKRSLPALPQRQRGMATLYVVLAVGLAVSVSVAASYYALRGDQQRQITTHSVTSAQAAAWRGVEVLRRYLLAVDQSTLASWSSNSGGLGLPAPVNGLSDLGIPDGNAVITSINGSGSDFQIGASVTALAGSGSTLTSATVDVLFDITAGGSGSSPPPTCAVIPVAPMVFNGDLVIRGGSLSVANASGFEQIAVGGNIDLTSASTARISGCAKGNVSLSGGGIVSGGHLHSEGNILVNAMQNPSDTTLWGRSVTVGSGVSGGGYTAIKGGAFSANVFANGTLVGSTALGGRLQAGTTNTGLPWTIGTVLPVTSGRITLRLANGDVWLLDLAKVTPDSSTGVISGASAVAERLSGSSGQPLPDVLSFTATGIAGGDVSVATLGSESGAVGVKQMWGHNVSITGWNGHYQTLFANGDLSVVTGRISRLIGGRDVIARNANPWSNFPNIVSGDIAGELRYASGEVVPAGTAAAPAGLRRRQSGTSPGLPGIPFCDTRTNRIDVDTYRGAANYIFEWLDNAPRLTIQNVRTADGRSLDGSYNLASDDVRRLPGNGESFLTCNWQQAANGAAHCFRDKTASNAWSVTGLTHFPRGVAWFDTALNINGIQLRDADGNRALINTLVAKGTITLTTGSSDKDLTAPNFATPTLLCGGAYRPHDLCDNSSGSWQLAQWQDGSGVMRRGLPVGNMAIVTEGAGSLGGWNIRGNVLLGRELGNNANATVINGSLTVGSNQAGSTTSIEQGGAQVNVPQSQDQQYLPGLCEAPPTSPSGPASATVRWSRYL